MKYLIFLIVFNLFAQDDVYVEKKINTVAEEVYEIKNLMVNLEDILHEDRYDQIVQLKGKEIENKIEKLIKDAEEIDDNNLNKNSKVNAPKKDSKIDKKNIDEALKVIHRNRPLWETSSYDNWAKLQNCTREGIIQTYREELPVLWEKRIRAYFLSINSEEDDRLDKILKKKQAYIKSAIIARDADNIKWHIKNDLNNRIESSIQLPDNILKNVGDKKLDYIKGEIIDDDIKDKNEIKK